MAYHKERRFLHYKGASHVGSAQVNNTFYIENTGMRLVAASLAHPIRVQVLAGDNPTAAAATQWADFTSPYGEVVALSAGRSFLQLVQGGKYRLNPDDLPLNPDGFVWVADDQHLAAERVRFTYDQYAGNPASAAQAAALTQATQNIADAVTATAMPPTAISSPAHTVAVAMTAPNIFEVDIDPENAGVAIAGNAIATAALKAAIDTYVNGFTIVDNGDGSASITAHRNNMPDVVVGNVDAAASDISSFTAVNDTVTITLADGTVMPATTADDFSTAGVLNAGHVTVTRNSGGTFDIDLSDLNETVTDNADGFTKEFRSGGNIEATWADGTISAALGNALVRDPTDKGLFVNAGTAPVYSEVVGGSVFSIPLPPTDHAHILLRPNSSDAVAELPDGAFDNQIVRIEVSGLAGDVWALRHTGATIHAPEQDGLPILGRDYYVGDKSCITFMWRPAVAGALALPARWVIVSEVNGVSRGERLVFSGTVLPGASIPAGFSNVPLLARYDPENRWHATQHRYVARNDSQYRIDVSMPRMDAPAGALTHYRANNGTLVPLPTQVGQYFMFNYTGFHNAAGGVSGKQSYLSFNLRNNSGAALTFDPAWLSVDRHYWRIEIYRTFNQT